MTLGSIIYAFLIIAAILIVCYGFWYATTLAPPPLQRPLQVLIVVLGCIAVALVLVNMAGGFSVSIHSLLEHSAPVALT